MLTTLFSRLKNLNFFSSFATANNEYELQNERISTRIFLIILILSILIITSYTAQVSIRQTVEIKNPSYEEFQILSNKYSQALNCPCDKTTIPQETFIDLKPRFHQLCTSDFVMPNWINYFDSAADVYISDDFSYTGGLMLNILASF